jgi:hypothetical protein
MIFAYVSAASIQHQGLFLFSFLKHSDLYGHFGFSASPACFMPEKNITMKNDIPNSDKIFINNDSIFNKQKESH